MPSGAEKIPEQADVDIDRAGHLHGWAAWCELSGAQCGRPNGVMASCLRGLYKEDVGRGGNSAQC